MRSREVLLGSLATTLVLAGSVACGSARRTDATCSCTVDAGAGPSLASPPSPPATMHPGDGAGTVTFAFTTIIFAPGDAGTPDPDAWKQLGYNIDGVSPADPTAFCKPAAGGSEQLVREEGVNGIENAFGHMIAPMLAGMGDGAMCWNTLCGKDAIQLGDYTVLLSLDALGAGSSYDPLTSHLAEGGNLGGFPRFDGTDVWPVVDGTTLALPASYLVNDTWVSGPIASVSVSISNDGWVLPLDLRHVVLTMNLDPTHQSATGGVISGVLPTAALQERARTMAGEIDPTLCSSSTLANVLTEIAQASDIMHDGTQDPTKTCDAISVGLGFKAHVVHLGPTMAPGPTMPDPCIDAGADG